MALNLRTPGVFGDEQAINESASVEDRLLAFAGRKILVGHGVKCGEHISAQRVVHHVGFHLIA